MYLGLLRLHQLLPEGQVFLLGQGAVDVVGGALVVAGGEVGAGHVHAVVGHQRGGGVEEIQGVTAAQLFGDGVRQRVGGQGAGGDDHRAVGDGGDLAGHKGDEGVRQQGLRDHAGKALPVNGQSAAGGNGGGVGTAEDQAVQTAQFFLE